VNDRLYRSRSDRMLAGVAGGLAELWDADPSLVRIVWALLVIFTGGVALLVYIVMAVVVPEEDDVWPMNPAGPMPSGATTTTPSTGEDMRPIDPASAGTATPAAGPGSDLAAGLPLVTPSPQPGALWASPPVDPRRAARIEARAARHAARAERRQAGGLTGSLVGGLILVALGVFFLAREWLPQISFDWFWPAMLIVLGALLLLTAVGRSPRDPGSST
jgi:phage shock protein PspC (stress-responsive transcriptional regulator)